jgi:short-subunit dehydrogenase
MKLRSGDVALITGASKGLGFQIALAMKARRMRLVLVARTIEQLQQAAQRLAGGEGNVLVGCALRSRSAEVCR